MGCGSSAQVATADSTERKIDVDEQADSDVFVTPLATANGGSFVDLGLVTTTYVQCRIGARSGDLSATITKYGNDTDKARAMSLAKLRTRCKQMGGNAILSVRFDVETQGAIKICVATGAAVILAKGGNNDNNKNNNNNSVPGYNYNQLQQHTYN